MKPDLILWDWDNTLINSMPVVRAALDDVVLWAHLPPITQQDVIDVMGTHRGRYWQEHFPHNMDEAIPYYLSRYAAHTDKLELFPETVDVLRWVQSSGIPQWVVSNKNKKLLLPECDRFALWPYFEKVVGTDETKIAKPSQAFADQIFADGRPTNILMIGDGESDMQFADRIGAFGLFVRPGEGTMPFPYNARVSDLAGVWTFLKQYCV